MINSDGRLDNNKLNQKQIEVSGSLDVHLPLPNRSQRLLRSTVRF